jgi:hypothetical protein
MSRLERVAEVVYDCEHVELADPKCPNGYLEWHAWAEEQTKLGRRQKLCTLCGFYYWPAARTADKGSE